MFLYYEVSIYLCSEMVKVVKVMDLNVKEGLIVIGDIFVDFLDKIKEILMNFFEVLVCEMEGVVVG